MKYATKNQFRAEPVTCATASTAYPANNLRLPERRYLPAISTSIADTRWTIDTVANPDALSVNIVHLVRTNFATCRIQANATDVWTSPTYNQLITVTRNPFNRQYQHTHVAVAALGLRYVSVFVPAQTPVEAPLTAFRVGGVYGGILVEAPSRFAIDYAHHVDWPANDEGPPYRGGFRQRLQRASGPLVRLTAQRRGRFTHATPYLAGDDVTKWLDVEHDAWGFDFFLLYEDLGNANMGWVVRSLNQETRWDPEPDLPGVARSDWELEEVIGP